MPMLMFATGLLLAVGCWLLAIGYWLLALGFYAVLTDLFVNPARVQYCYLQR